MEGWSQSVPNHKDGTADVLNDKRATDQPFFQVDATFTAPEDEHYYGLGQNHEGFLDHRGHTVECWHNYTATGGPSVCVPFLVANKGYGLIWNNPSRTTIEPGFNERTKWTSEVGNRVSFFVIAGNTTDEIYAGYRLLTGATPLLPKSAYGYIQCKQRYRSQAEVLSVAEGYRQRHLPLDTIVVDWLYYTRMGQMDLDPALWPDPAAMNAQLHAMGIQTMISVWPRFAPGSQFYDTVRKNGWFEHLADGTPTDGLPYDRAGSDIDTTNPDAAKWYWTTIRDKILSKGFNSIWADETEPDLPPQGSFFHVGPGTRFYNTYPSSIQPRSTTAAAATRRTAPSSCPGTLTSAFSAMVSSSGRRTSTPPGIPSAARSPRGSISPPPESPTGATTRAVGSTFPHSIILCIRHSLTLPTPATTSAATTIIPSSTRAGLSTPASFPSSAPMAAAMPTRSGPTASRRNRSSKST